MRPTYPVTRAYALCTWLRGPPQFFVLRGRAVADLSARLGFIPFEVGVIATASLLGSGLLTMCDGFLGARHDHSQLLLAGARLMIATGVAFAVVHDYALLLVIPFAGTISSG